MDELKDEEGAPLRTNFEKMLAVHPIFKEQKLSTCAALEKWSAGTFSEHVEPVIQAAERRTRKAAKDKADAAADAAENRAAHSEALAKWNAVKATLLSHKPVLDVPVMKRFLEVQSSAELKGHPFEVLLKCGLDDYADFLAGKPVSDVEPTRWADILQMSAVIKPAEASEGNGRKRKPTATFEAGPAKRPPPAKPAAKPAVAAEEAEPDEPPPGGEKKRRGRPPKVKEPAVSGMGKENGKSVNDKQSEVVSKEVEKLRKENAELIKCKSELTSELSSVKSKLSALQREVDVEKARKEMSLELAELKAKNAMQSQIMQKFENGIYRLAAIGTPPSASASTPGSM